MAAQDFGSAPRPRRRWLFWLRAVALLIAFAAVVVVTLSALHVTSEPRVDDPAHRDLVYFGIHGAGLLGALVLGFIVGAVLRTSAALTGFAFLVLTLMALMAAQAGSYELACRGHNDLIRHWECR